MPTIIDFNEASAEPRDSAPAPERILDGQPTWRSWLYLSENGMTSGRWESTPGCWTIAYDKWEFMTILSGRGVVRGEDGSRTELVPGATLVINPGFKGTWEVLEPMAKHFFVRLR